MKTNVFPSLLLCLLATLVLFGCVGPDIAVNAKSDFSRIQRVAVATFNGPGGDMAADLLTQDLLQRGADVIERQRLDAVLQEQHLAKQNVLNPATAKKIGEILGVDAIFVGTVGNYLPSQSYLVTTETHGVNYNTVTPISGSTVYSSGVGTMVPGSQIVTSAASVSLIARMVDVESGSILWSGRMSYEGLDSQVTMANITDSFVETLVPLWPVLHK